MIRLYFTQKREIYYATFEFGSGGNKKNLLITGMRRKSLSRFMYFNNFMPLAKGRSSSASMISILAPSAFSASITCLADLTEVTAKQEIKSCHPSPLSKCKK